MSISERIQRAFDNYVCAIEKGLGRKLNMYELEMTEEAFGDNVSISAMIYQFSYER